jgi:hypothetical protein
LEFRFQWGSQESEPKIGIPNQAQEREYTHSIGMAIAPIYWGHTLGWVNVWNKCAFCLIGYSTDNVMEQLLVQELLANAYQESVQAVLNKALTADKTNIFEFSLMTKEGAHIEVVLNVTTRCNK